MVRCNECHSEIKELPFKCKFCGQYHCGSHRLPEDHHCTGLPRRNVFDNLKGSKRKPHNKHNKSRHTHHKSNHTSHKKQHHHTQQSRDNKLVRFMKNKYHQVKYWMNKREHRKFNNWNKILYECILGCNSFSSICDYIF
jgi:hypothetical protein